MEPEFYEMLPKGFSVHTSRLALREVTVDGLVKMEEAIEAEALKLRDADVEAIGYGCTSGSLFRGLNHDKNIVERIQRITARPAVCTSGAIVSALRELSVKKVAVGTPYIDEINDLEKEFLQANGFQVVDLQGFGIKENTEIGKLCEQDTYELIMGLKHGLADGVFISCTNLRTLSVVSKLEKTLMKPVISSNTATLWAMLRLCGVSTKIHGFGELLERML